MHTISKDSSKHLYQTSNLNPIAKYKHFAYGDISLSKFLLQEFLFTILGPLPGASGYFLRKLSYKPFFKNIGQNTTIGCNCSFFHTDKISLGHNVYISDNCHFDARGCQEDGLYIGDGVIINRGSSLKSKYGDISVGNRSAIGANCWMVSFSGILIGKGTGIAPGCNIVGGKSDVNLDKPFMDKESISNGPIKIGDNSWVATGVIILDNVSIGDNVIVSAGSVVSTKIEDNTIALGNPAKVIFKRR